MSNRRFSCLVSGPEGAPWITLSHPIGSSKELWQAQREALEARFRVLAYDTRGHGASAMPEGPATFDDLAADVLALWDELGVERSHFVGESLGGCVGVALAHRAPQRVASLTVACARLQMDEPAAKMWLDRAALVEAQGMEPTVEGTLDRWLTPGFREAHPREVARIRDTLLATSPAGFAACARALAAGQPLERLAALAMPVLYLAGAEDKAVSAELVRQYHALTPGSRFALLPGPHLLNVESPGPFMEALLGLFGN